MHPLIPIILSLNLFFCSELLPAAPSNSFSFSSGEISVCHAAYQFSTDFLSGETSTESEAVNSQPDVLNLSAPSALLMEASTGTILYEKDSHATLRPASITKIMTLILIFDALSSGQISLEDSVTVSEYAASMGGSQVFLEAGETQTVDTMIKCISVASANDACVAYTYGRHYD